MAQVGGTHSEHNKPSKREYDKYFQHEPAHEQTTNHEQQMNKTRQTNNKPTRILQPLTKPHTSMRSFVYVSRNVDRGATIAPLGKWVLKFLN